MRVLFRLRKQPAAKSHVLYCRLTIDGERANDFSLKIKLTPDAWDQKAQQVRGRTEEAQAQNLYLSQIRATVYQAAAALQAQGQEITADRVRSLLMGSRRTISLLGAYQLLLADKKRQGLHARTLQAYQKAQDLLREFLGHIGRPMLRPSEADAQLADTFWDYLRHHRALGNDYSVRQLEYLRAALLLCVKRGQLAASPLAHYSRRRKAPALPVVLSQQQLLSLRLHRYASPALQRAADLFTWQAYTGMDYSDTASFDYRAHVQEVDGRLWIVRYREKGGRVHPYELPLHPLALGVLLRYDYQLPRLSNARYNLYLKEISAILDLRLRLTTHTGRKTFATWCINELGISYEALSRMLGHTTTKVTEATYARVNRSRLLGELAGRLEGAAAAAQPDQVGSR